jgi:Asp-tRNA(Asn)/Glu-tRNA(Gln) amidotransferase A subunit family amidase
LSADGLKGVRIGVLKQLFGTAPEDEEVASIVRASLDAMKKAGAELVDVTIPGLEEQMQGSSVINCRIQVRSAGLPRATYPIRRCIHSARSWTAADITPALDATFRLRNRPGKARDGRIPAGAREAIGGSPTCPGRAR